MEKLAAIDIGSNAIRIVIGEVDEHGDIRVLKKVREPVRLGEDVFATGEISVKTQERAVITFLKFRALLKEYDVHHYKAIATSALRETKNRDTFIQSIRKASGIQIEVIDGIEEGRLVFSAVSHRVYLQDSVALLIDIGGGSVELSVADHGKLKSSQSFKLGTVRLLQLLEQKKLKDDDLRKLIDQQLAPVKTFLDQALKGLHVDLALGTGGNFECLGKLRVALLNKNSIFSMTRDELGLLSDHLQKMTVKERIQFLRLRPDRADVVVPAALVTLAVMDLAQTDLLTIPFVGLRDGILADISHHIPIQVMK